MPKLYKLLDDKRFNELDEEDRNIRTQIMSNNARHVAQFDTPMKFQNKFTRMTAYEFTRGLELVKRELEAIVNEYNTGTLENRDNTGKLISYWNTLMGYLKHMLLVGGLANRDIQKINNLLDELKPLVNDVAMIAEEKDFVDKDQIEELADKFLGNNWTAVIKLQRKKRADEVEAPEIDDELDEEDDGLGVDGVNAEGGDEEAPEDDELPPLEMNEGEEEVAPDEEDEDEDEPPAPPAEEEEEELEEKAPPPKKSRLVKYQQIIQNISGIGIDKLKEYYLKIFKENINSSNKNYVKNKLRTKLNQKIAQLQAPAEIVLEGDGKPSSRDSPKYLKLQPAPMRYNDMLDDYYLLQGMK